MGVDITPVFYKADESTAVGLLPISLDIPSGIYTITFVYGGTTQETNITIENDGEKTSNYQLSDTIINTYRTEANLTAFSNTVEKLTATGSSERYFEGYFLEGISGDSTLLRGFGTGCCSSKRWRSGLRLLRLPIRWKHGRNRTRLRAEDLVLQPRLD